MNTRLIAAAAAVGLALCGAGTAGAVDNLIPGKITIIKDGKLFKVVAKPPSGTFPLPMIGGGGDPLLGDGGVSVIDTAGGGSLSDSLSAGTWSGIGNPPGIKGYKYSNAAAPGGGPVKLIILKGTVIKILAKDDGTLDGPVDGAVGIILSTGTAPDRYCAQFGGTDIKNDPGLVKRKDAPAPGGCPVVTPPTTTTTIPSGPVCGNGMVESPETCDDGNTVNADGCPADCIVDPCSQTPNPGGVLTVNVVNNESGQTTFGVVTVFIDYPEGKVLIPGTADDSQVQAAITDEPTTGSPTCVVNDRDHGVRFGCLSTNGFNEGLFFRINHTDCASVGPPALGEFNCQILEATDTIGFDVSATCTLSYAP